MKQLEQLRSTYLEQNTQFILADKNGVIIETDNVLFKLKKGIFLETVHPVFFNILEHIKTEDGLRLSCVHFNIENTELICDISIEKIKDSADFVIIISDFSKHYNSFLSLAQSRNETAIEAETLAIHNLILSKREAFKDKFITNFNHEIISPIQSIITFSEVLDSTKLNPDQKQYLEIITNSATILKSMTNDIFDLSRIETGNLLLDKKRFSFKKLISLIEKEYQQKCKEKHLSFEVDYKDDMPIYIVADKIRVQQILKNLLTNALKFTEEGGISLTIKPIYSRARKITFVMEVTDTGEGISKADQNEIFKRFKRLKATSHIQGNGLGLTISKELCELMDGQLSVESTIGKGSTFSATIRATTPLKTKEKFENTIVKNEIKELLLVENNINDQISIFKTLAQSKRYFLDIAASGKEAINLCKNKSYDLILMDYKMSDLTGLETSKIINSGKKQTPIVIITGYKIDEKITQYFKDYYTTISHKPFDKQTLEQQIEMHIK